MAKQRSESKSEPTEPEVRAYAVIQVRGGLWVARTMLIQGDRVLAFEDTEADTRNACLGRVLGALRSEG